MNFAPRVDVQIPGSLPSMSRIGWLVDWLVGWVGGWVGSWLGLGCCMGGGLEPPSEGTPLGRLLQVTSSFQLGDRSPRNLAVPKLLSGEKQHFKRSLTSQITKY